MEGGNQEESSGCANEERVARVGAGSTTRTNSVYTKRDVLIGACVARGYRFELVNNMEGHWSGATVIVDMPDPDGCSDAPERLRAAPARDQVSSLKMSWQPQQGLWVMRETTADRQGISSTTTFQLLPVGNGALTVNNVTEYGPHQVRATDLYPSLLDTQIYAAEAPDGLRLSVVDRATRRLRCQSDFMLQDDLIQRTHMVFDFHGKLRTTAVSRQFRVVTTVEPKP